MNSSPPVSISNWLQETTSRLARSTSPRLDALVLLEDAMQRDKAWLLSHNDVLLSQAQLQTLNHWRQRRQNGEPLAYIRGHQAFYGRNFAVTPAVLIPRPETETLVELLLTLPVPSESRLLDVGTGSGQLAITAALERPQWQIAASDISPTALEVAKKNANRLQASITFHQADLLNSITGTFEIITANLPYVAANWHRSPETIFEPSLALFADQAGLALIQQLIVAAPQRLTQPGWLLLEADPRQHAAIRSLAVHQGFSVKTTQGFIVVLERL